MTRAIELTVWGILLAAGPALAQGRPQTPPPPPPGVTPQPVGRPDATRPASGTGSSAPTAAAPATAAPAATRQAPPVRPPATGAASRPEREVLTRSVLPTEPVPTEALLGVPIHPSATFLKSYDAGRGQRYYLFGSMTSFAELVLYYRTQLRTRGDLVYDEPPVHMFEVGRFREETMAFPPGVTVKDYTWGGGKGYLVPVPGANPSRYPTIIQIVPVVAGR